jgi:hypothetical protein
MELSEHISTLNLRISQMKARFREIRAIARLAYESGIIELAEEGLAE